jgi:hypothetical protein
MAELAIAYLQNNEIQVRHKLIHKLFVLSSYTQNLEDATCVFSAFKSENPK